MCKQKSSGSFKKFYVETHHHHQVVSLARISLTLSRLFSLSFIASGRSSGLHPVSSYSCWMYVRAGHPAFARPYMGVHRSTLLMSSSLLLQQCSACLVRQTWIVFVMVKKNYVETICLKIIYIQNICINRIWHWITSKGWYAVKHKQHLYMHIFLYACISNVNLYIYIYIYI